MGAETASSLIAWWGAGLSTVLATVKLFELWRDRFRVDISYNFTGSESVGNEILIRNLSSRPLILTHWSLEYRSNRWTRQRFEAFENAELDAADSKIEPYGTHIIRFVDGNYFHWGHKTLNGRKIFIRLHIAG